MGGGWEDREVEAWEVGGSGGWGIVGGGGGGGGERGEGEGEERGREMRRKKDN